MKANEFVTVDVRFNKKEYGELKKIADKAGTTVSIVINVVMALSLRDLPSLATKK